jgi:hypothetical protein
MTSQEIASTPVTIYPHRSDFMVDEGIAGSITNMRERTEPGDVSLEWAAGNVIQRLCAYGGEACAKQCVRMQEVQPDDKAYEAKMCAEENIMDICEEMGLPPEKLLLVGVTADKVGFYDQLDQYEGLVNNPRGFRQLPGFNAFFAHESDDVALARRLADCGDVHISFKDEEGKRVFGFAHLSRPNMKGDTAFTHERDGEKVGVFSAFLGEALEHYGGDVSSVEVRNAAAVSMPNFTHWFKDEDALNKSLPGWYELGFARNRTFEEREGRPWQRGDEIKPTDAWDVDYQEMVHWQLRQVLGEEQISREGIIDPGELHLGHATNAKGRPARVGRVLLEGIDNAVGGEARDLSRAELNQIADGIDDEIDREGAHSWLDRFVAGDTATHEELTTLREEISKINVPDGRDLYVTYPVSILEDRAK